MSDEENKDRKKKRNAGLDLIGESARKALEQQEEQRRELMEQVLGPNKALHDANSNPERDNGYRQIDG